MAAAARVGARAWAARRAGSGVGTDHGSLQGWRSPRYGTRAPGGPARARGAGRRGRRNGRLRVDVRRIPSRRRSAVRVRPCRGGAGASAACSTHVRRPRAGSPRCDSPCRPAARPGGEGPPPHARRDGRTVPLLVRVASTPRRCSAPVPRPGRCGGRHSAWRARGGSCTSGCGANGAAHSLRRCNVSGLSRGRVPDHPRPASGHASRSRRRRRGGGHSHAFRMRSRSGCAAQADRRGGGGEGHARCSSRGFAPAGCSRGCGTAPSCAGGAGQARRRVGHRTGACAGSARHTAPDSGLPPCTRQPCTPARRCVEARRADRRRAQGGRHGRDSMGWRCAPHRRNRG